MTTVFCSMLVSLNLSAQEKVANLSMYVEQKEENVAMKKEWLDTSINAWPAASQTVAKQNIGKYGIPTEGDAEKLVWMNNGPYKQTIIYKEGMTHKCAKTHTDVVVQVIEMRVPAHKLFEFQQYAVKAGIIVYKNRNLISSSCDNDAVNVLNFNLAYELVNGSKSLTQVMALYDSNMKLINKGKKADYAETILWADNQYLTNN
jgi:hypothetical protein